MKNPLTLAGIEPATIRFVEQHLNHCATPGRAGLLFLLQSVHTATVFHLSPYSWSTEGLFFEGKLAGA